MSRQLNIAGKNSDDIYTLFYPSNLMNFCRYDFSLFLEHCTDLCRLAARTGEYNVDDVYSIRNSISGCHKYYEQNMRTTFEKIVVDCWIDYLCKQSEISVNTLWQSFMKCRNPFEKAIFGRLSEYRYNKAINEWTNLLRLQEYARVKTDFVFGVKLSSPQQAVSRANYFDLLFNVAANEQGFPIGEIASVGVFSAGRLPNSPFVMNSAAKEIARNQLKNIEYKDVYRSRKNPDLTDKIAMDAFSSVKNYIPDKNDSMAKTIIKSLSSAPQYIYVPGSFKAIIDLEIDVSAQSGAYLQKCARCGDYYIRDEEYDFDYCSRIQREGGTCLELMKIDDPELAEAVAASAIEYDEEPEDKDEPKIIYVDKDTVTSKMDALYKEMAARVNVDMTQRDFSIWYQRELRLKDDILLGEAGEKQLNDFIELSRGDEFASKKHAPLFEKKEEPAVNETDEEDELTDDGKHIKKFVFEKIDRESTTAPISSPAVPTTLAESEKAAMDAVRKLFAAEKNKPGSSLSQNITNRQSPYIQQTGFQNYDPAGMDAYSDPSQYNNTPNNQPQMSQGFTPQVSGYTAGSQYGGQNMPNAAVPPNVTPFQPQQPYINTQSQQPYGPRPVSRIIKGGSAQAQEYAARSKSVIIPNGDEKRTSFLEQMRRNREAERKNSVEGISSQDTRTVPVIKEKEPETRVYETDDDIKVFTPRRNNIFASKQNNDYIEPSPYEKLRQTIEDYDKERSVSEEEEVDGQISAEEIVKPAAPAPASAVAAYRGYSSAGNQGNEDTKFDKADFSRILEGIKREDGFARDETLVDSDGLPVSHKTKHVMDALFRPSKASPILRVNLDDDDDDN